ncbi:hypothetical protein HanIR_Chr12g0590531 [Helianthus annuus]|nr:hypothetical protein HanIR_Chr12g0590531 [Helianthus annuus]
MNTKKLKHPNQESRKRNPIVRKIANTGIKRKLPLTEWINGFVLRGKNRIQVRRDFIFTNKLIQLALGKHAHALRHIIFTRSHIKQKARKKTHL